MSAPAPIRRTPDSFDAKEREVISCRALYQSHGELANVKVGLEAAPLVSLKA